MNLGPDPNEDDPTPRRVVTITTLTIRRYNTASNRSAEALVESTEELIHDTLEALAFDITDITTQIKGA